MTGLLRIVSTAVLLALVVFLFAGCGGSDVPVTPTRTARTTEAAGGSTSKAEDLIGQIVIPGMLSPADFKQSIETRRPIVVTFYITGSGGPADDSQVRSSIMSLESKYRGQVDFYTYNYTDSEDYGDLTAILKVTTTPTVIIINPQSQVQRAWSGYVDISSIEQGINEATGIAGSGGSSYSGGSSNTSTSTSTTGSSTTGTTNNMNSAPVMDDEDTGPTP